MNKELKVGDMIGGGDILGYVKENPLFKKHSIMVDPKLNGKIVETFDSGSYTVADTVCTIEDINGKTHDLKMSHFWPVRKPRPVTEKLPATEPLLTG